MGNFEDFVKMIVKICTGCMSKQTHSQMDNKILTKLFYAPTTKYSWLRKLYKVSLLCILMSWRKLPNLHPFCSGQC